MMNLVIQEILKSCVVMEYIITSSSVFRHIFFNTERYCGSGLSIFDVLDVDIAESTSSNTHSRIELYGSLNMLIQLSQLLVSPKILTSAITTVNFSIEKPIQGWEVVTISPFRWNSMYLANSDTRQHYLQETVQAIKASNLSEFSR